MSDLINNSIDNLSNEAVERLLGIVTNVNKTEKAYLAKQTAKMKDKLANLQSKIKEIERNTPMQSKEQFQTELDKLNLSNELKAVAFTILDIGLAKLNRLPISITQENKISVKLEYYNHAASIMYVEGNIYGKYKYCDLESGIGELELEECFGNRANLKLIQQLEDWKSNFKYIQEQHQKDSERWRKMHSYLNSILGLECDNGCITDEDELILAVQKKIEEDLKNEKCRCWGQIV